MTKFGRGQRDKVLRPRRQKLHTAQKRIFAELNHEISLKKRGGGEHYGCTDGSTASLWHLSVGGGGSKDWIELEGVVLTSTTSY